MLAGRFNARFCIGSNAASRRDCSRDRASYGQHVHRTPVLENKRCEPLIREQGEKFVWAILAETANHHRMHVERD